MNLYNAEKLRSTRFYIIKKFMRLFKKYNTVMAPGEYE